MSYTITKLHIDARKWASDDLSRPEHLRGILLEPSEGRARATDGHRAITLPMARSSAPTTLAPGEELARLKLATGERQDFERVEGALRSAQYTLRTEDAPNYPDFAEIAPDPSQVRARIGIDARYMRDLADLAVKHHRRRKAPMVELELAGPLDAIVARFPAEEGPVEAVIMPMRLDSPAADPTDPYEALKRVSTERDIQAGLYHRAREEAIDLRLEVEALRGRLRTIEGHLSSVPGASLEERAERAGKRSEAVPAPSEIELSNSLRALAEEDVREIEHALDDAEVPNEGSTLARVEWLCSSLARLTSGESALEPLPSRVDGALETLERYEDVCEIIEGVDPAEVPAEVRRIRAEWLAQRSTVEIAERATELMLEIERFGAWERPTFEALRAEVRAQGASISLF